MKARHIVAYFDRIADAPDSIPRLRQYILDLAVQGKLVEQDPGNEPASELLNRIWEEKERLFEEKKINRLNPRLPFESGEIAIQVPLGWAWVRISDLLLGESQNGYSKRPDDALDGVPILRISAGTVRKDGIVAEEEHKLIGDVSSAQQKQYELQSGDLLACRFNGNRNFVGRLSLYLGYLGIKPIYPDKLIRLRLLSQFVLPKLVRCFAESSIVRKDIEGYCATTVGNWGISASNLINVKIPLPPLAEQHRIVAKVDELMTLCNRLEAAQAERESRRDRLAAASLQRLNQPADTPTFREHARFHLSHLQRLTTRPEQITQLRDTILQLAVLGRLSEQLPQDGDAQDLLSDVNGTRRKSRKIPLAGTQETLESLPNLPDKWAWAITDQVAANDDNAITDGPFGANLKTDHYIETPGYRVVRLQNIGRGHFRNENRSYIDKDRFESLAKHWIFAGDLVVAGLVDPFVRCCEVPHDIGPALVKADCYRFKVHPNFLARFVQYYFNSPLCQRFAAIHHHGMTLVRIGLGNFRRIPIPVPPLPEQHRIVAKVDELMALCDRLEAQLTTTQTQSRRLLEAVLHEALAGA